jgi:heme a synthase
MNFLKNALLISLAISMLVIAMGAYTRLSDAGLGCPDWPGCYGYLSVPSSLSEIASAESAFPESAPVVSEKAWPEMIHRYLAASFGLLAIGIALYHISLRMQTYVAASLLALIIFQATLGLWTVTLKLHPLVVMLHLLGGFVISILLLWLLLGPRKEKSSLDKWAYLILCTILIQVFFGAWTSANYSSLICPDFPFCQGMLFPKMSFKGAFNFLPPLGDNYQYGVLDNISRVTIHMTHRYFAIITSFSIITFLIYAFYQNNAPRMIIYFVALLLFTQIGLGIMNVVYLLPTFVALAHNICGLLLLLSWTWLTHSLSNSTQTQ